MGKYNFIYSLLKRSLKRKGYGSIGGKRVVNMMCDDFFNYKATSLSQKRWAYKRGFPSERIIRFGLTEENYKDFMSEGEYYKLKSHFNSPLGNWYDNKLTTRHLLRKFDSYLEDYYLYLKGGVLIRLMDCPSDFENSYEGVVRWLQSNGPLAAKSIKGSLGFGFYKLSFENGRFLVSGKEYSEQEFLSFLKSLNHYVLVGYIRCHKDLLEIHNGSANALRVMTIYDYKTNKSHITGSYIRFGTDKSGPVEHIIYGGILSGVQLEDGKLYKGLTYKKDHYIEITEHPDTHKSLLITLPNWELICEKVLEIANYMPATPHLTYDIIITDDGFRVLEINSHSDISNMQIYYPFFKNEYNKRLYELSSK